MTAIQIYKNPVAFNCSGIIQLSDTNRKALVTMAFKESRLSENVKAGRMKKVF